MLTGRHHAAPAGRAFTLMLLFMTIHILTACSPKVVERIVVRRDTVAVHHRDTTYRRDSVYIREWMKGDTVYIDRYRDRYVFRDRWRDSVTVRVDSVAVERIKEVKVEKPLSWWKRVKIGAFPWLLLAVAGLLLWTFRKRLP